MRNMDCSNCQKMLVLALLALFQAIQFSLGQACSTKSQAFKRYSFQPICNASVTFYPPNNVSCVIAAAVSSTPAIAVMTSSPQICHVISAQCPRYKLADNDLTVYVPSGLTAMEFIVLCVKRASGFRVYDLLTNPASRQDYAIPSSALTTLPDAFRSNLLDNMQSMISRLVYKRMIVQVYKNSTVVVRLVFDVGTTTTQVNIMNWFSKERLVQSYPVTDLATKTFNYFNIVGETSQNLMRRFFVNFHYGGCDIDKGLMTVLDTTYDTCAIYRFSAAVPRIVYSSDVTRPMAQTITDADYFAILVV